MINKLFSQCQKKGIREEFGHHEALLLVLPRECERLLFGDWQCFGYTPSLAKKLGVLGSIQLAKTLAGAQ